MLGTNGGYMTQTTVTEAELKQIIEQYESLELEKKGALGLFETFNAAKSGIKGLGQTIVNTAEKAGAKNLANTLGHDIGQSVAKGQKLLGYKAKDFSGNIVNLGIS